MLARLCLILLLLGAEILPPASARAAPADSSVLSRVEAWFSSIRYLSARFVQITNDGRYSEGRIWLSRPGGMRFEYIPPSVLTLITNGEQVALHDRAARQNQFFSAEDYPQIRILTRQTLKFGQDLIVSDVKQNPGLIEITTKLPSGDPDSTLTLFFSETPLQLRKWTTLDPQGTEITVALLDMDIHTPPDPNLFILPAHEEAEPATSGDSR